MPAIPFCHHLHPSYDCKGRAGFYMSLLTFSPTPWDGSRKTLTSH
nr:MAG TPA_asm: hypothetical protein [Caudoviricetes sp.]